MTRSKNLGLSADRYQHLAGFDSDWRDTWWHQDTLELMAKRLRLDAVRSVLDVGCGAGHWGQRVSTLLEPGATVTGVDHEPGFLDAARERAHRFDGDFTYVEGSALDLPFDDDAFDLVTCQTVLIHVADAEAALREMVRVTKPGGLVVAAEPNNLANALMTRICEPEVPPSEMHALLAFDHACLRGKRALGQGDSAVGDRLPSLMLDLGLEDRRVYKNDRCATWLPPYDTPAEQLSIEQVMRTEGDKVSLGFGDQETTRALFEAGGGDPGEFDAGWALSLKHDRRLREGVRDGTWRFAGGLMMYLAAGRKPA